MLFHERSLVQCALVHFCSTLSLSFSFIKSTFWLITSSWKVSLHLLQTGEFTVTFNCSNRILTGIDKFYTAHTNIKASISVYTGILVKMPILWYSVIPMYHYASFAEFCRTTVISVLQNSGVAIYILLYTGNTIYRNSGTLMLLVNQNTNIPVLRYTYEPVWASSMLLFRIR